MKAVMDGTPDYQVAVGDETTFWYAFGPVLYRGRLDGLPECWGSRRIPVLLSACRSRGARSSVTRARRRRAFSPSLDSLARTRW